MTETIADALACFARRTEYDHIPPDVRNSVKRSLLDTVAVAIGAGNASGAREALELAVLDGGSATSSVWVSGQRFPARSATFVNSLLASALDFDSLHPEAVVHADIVTIPAALAVAEAQCASGKDLVAAVAVGNEILCRLGKSTRRNSGWFYTSVYGSIASAAAVAKLLKASADQVLGAMGIGYLSSSGTQQPAVERSLGKRVQGALAATAGVTAGYLGARGLTGPREIVEGRFGLFRMYEDGDKSVIIDDLGDRFELASIAYKLYPSCQCNHAAIEGMLQIKRRHNLVPHEVKSIEVYVSEYMQRLVGAQFVPGSNPQVTAQFSVQYSIAAVLLYGEFGIKQIQDASILNPGIADLVARIAVIVDPENSNNYAPVRLKVIKHDEHMIDQEVGSYRGSSDMPLSDDDMKCKLADCLESSGRSARPDAVNRIYDFIMNIEREADLSTAIPHLIKSTFA